MKPLLVLFLISYASISIGQIKEMNVYEMPVPENIEQCFKILDETLPEKKINIIKTYSEDSIYFHKEFRYGTTFYRAWDLGEYWGSSSIIKYFEEKGIENKKEDKVYKFILVSYHRYLNKKTIGLDEQIEEYQKTQKDRKEKEHQEYLTLNKQDSIDEVYIPKNIEDCFHSLNKLLDDEDISYIKNLSSRDDMIQFHMGLGRWLRNHWGLWGGSRIKTYMTEKGIFHPDNMSGIILEFYYDWLNKEHDAWQKFKKNKQ